MKLHFALTSKYDNTSMLLIQLIVTIMFLVVSFMFWNVGLAAGKYAAQHFIYRYKCFVSKSNREFVLLLLLACFILLSQKRD